MYQSNLIINNIRYKHLVILNKPPNTIAILCHLYILLCHTTTTTVTYYYCYYEKKTFPSHWWVHWWWCSSSLCKFFLGLIFGLDFHFLIDNCRMILTFEITTQSHIISFLSCEDLLKLEQTCKHFKDIVCCLDYWKKVFSLLFLLFSLSSLFSISFIIISFFH